MVKEIVVKGVCMFATLQMQLETNEEMIQYQKAVILQSILMENIDLKYAENMHVSALHPYSQAVFNKNGKNIWKICVLSSEAYQNIIEPLLSQKFCEFTIEHNNCVVNIIEKQLETITKEKFLDKYYFSDSDRYIKIVFQTPTAFKSQGKYIYYPDIRLIYQSLMNKYDAAAFDEVVYSEDVLEQLVEYSTVTQYNLKSCSYFIGKARVPAFIGQITIKVNGPQALVNFVNFLFRFGEYSGVGIKAGMGMGNIHIVERV